MENKVNILVVENDTRTLELVSETLEKIGYSVYTATSGEVGLSMAGKISPALILVNLSTPGTKGLEICKTLHGDEALKDIPIILLTLRDGKFDPAYTKLYGIVDFLKKPVDSETLISTIKQHQPLGEVLREDEEMTTARLAQEMSPPKQGWDAPPDAFVVAGDEIHPADEDVVETPQLKPQSAEESIYGDIPEEENADMETPELQSHEDALNVEEIFNLDSFGETSQSEETFEAEPDEEEPQVEIFNLDSSEETPQAEETFETETIAGNPLADILNEEPAGETSQAEETFEAEPTEDDPLAEALKEEPFGEIPQAGETFEAEPPEIGPDKELPEEELPESDLNLDQKGFEELLNEETFDIPITSTPLEQPAKAYSKSALRMPRKRKSKLVPVGIVAVAAGLAVAALIFLKPESLAPFMKAKAPEKTVLPKAPEKEPPSLDIKVRPDAKDIPLLAANTPEKQKAGTTQKTEAQKPEKASSEIKIPSKSVAAGIKPAADKPKAAQKKKLVAKPKAQQKYYVQFGIFGSAKNARNLVRKLKGQGYDAFVKKGVFGKGATAHRVLLRRSYTSERSARDKARNIKNKKGIDTAVYTKRPAKG
jgi:CheY-like chemotaxis protein/cell division septation protein DedD